MATDRAAPWQPDWHVAPGEILSEAILERGISQSDLARRMGRPTKTINEIVNGKAAITPETAIQLERTLGISASFCNSLETRYRESLARESARKELERETDWLANFPLAELTRLGVIRRRGSKTDRLVDLLKYFAVSSPKAWETHWSRPLAAFRGSDSFLSSPYAVAAWLRRGELEAERLPPVKFDERAFRGLLESARELTRIYPPSAGLARLQEASARAGVLVLLVPEFSSTRLSGAARWLRPDRPVIQLSLRHRSDDHLWFTFFHEAGHLLGQRHDVVEELDGGGAGSSADEQQANDFARNTLMAPGLYAAFLESADFSADSVRAFAQKVGVAPGIVVGRLQRDGKIGKGQLNFLKQPVEWAAGT
jgi:HTH-type transcriptional regulator/antitoxin HigA